MADVKRDVRALGQKITGLKAGDNVTLVFRKPKPKVDATVAKKAVTISEEAINSARDLVRELTRARQVASSGKVADAKRIFDTARKAADKLSGELPRAKEWLEGAKADADQAVAEVKDGYGAAKDGADLAVGHLKNVAEGVQKAIGAVGAFIEEMAGRE
jgi:hypothetical protein